jgi:Kef-type K+ transport system membrane component KefB
VETLDPDLHLAIRVFAALSIVLVATSACGRLVTLVRQPRVVGEMVAGVLLGPSLFGMIAPSVQADLFSEDVTSVLYVLSTMGLTFYMFLVGASLDRRHTDRRSTRSAAILAVSGIVPTFLLGAGVAALFTSQLAAPGATPWKLMLFLGSALSITAFPMLARILQERGIANTRIGGLTLMAASVSDAVAWGLLALCIAVGVSDNQSSAAITIVGAAVFAVVMLTIVRRLLSGLGHWAARDSSRRRDAIAIVLLVVLAAGWFTNMIGVFSVFGGFIAGLAMPESPAFKREIEARLSDLTSILLLPVFFAFSGLNTDLRAITADSGLLLPLVAILLAATVGKYGGCSLTLRLQGHSWQYASAVGGLMNARGLMILIFINVGLSYQLITSELFSMLVVVAIVSTGAAMPIYRASMSPWMEDAEKRQELLPLRGR